MPSYSEKLRPSPVSWLLVPVAAVLAGTSTVPLGIGVAVGTALVLAVVVVVLLAARTPRVSVDDNGFAAGTARLPADCIGDVEALDEQQTRHAMGPGLRADAHVVHRAWVRTAVRVGVDDVADPTPYWVVSTRRPQELAAALVAARDAVERGDGSQAAHSEHTGKPPSS